jgi:hypothetical protein
MSNTQSIGRNNSQTRFKRRMAVFYSQLRFPRHETGSEGLRNEHFALFVPIQVGLWSWLE